MKKLPLLVMPSLPQTLNLIYNSRMFTGSEVVRLAKVKIAAQKSTRTVINNFTPQNTEILLISKTFLLVWKIQPDQLQVNKTSEHLESHKKVVDLRSTSHNRRNFF